MKWLLILLCTLILSGVTAFAQEGDCDKFRTGTFKYDDPEYGIIRFKRSETTQVEINAYKIEIHSSVKWTDDCKYVLTYKKVVGANIPFLVGRKKYVEIIDIRDDRYICIATDENGYGGRLEIIKMK